MAQSQPSAAREQVRNIVPGLIDLSERVLFGEVWERPGLSKRDRSLITCATLIALGREKQLVGHLQRALDNGLTKNELSEVITHLAFYSGWGNAAAAAAIVNDVFAARKIGRDELPAASPELLPLNKEAEEKRAASVEQQFGSVAPGVVQYTTDVLFRDLWLRPDLAPRDRSLVTVSALTVTRLLSPAPFGRTARARWPRRRRSCSRRSPGRRRSRPWRSAITVCFRG